MLGSGCSLWSGLDDGQSAHFSILFSSSAWLQPPLPSWLDLPTLFQVFPAPSSLNSSAFREHIINQRLVAL